MFSCQHRCRCFLRHPLLPCRCLSFSYSYHHQRTADTNSHGGLGRRTSSQRLILIHFPHNTSPHQNLTTRSPIWALTRSTLLTRPYDDPKPVFNLLRNQLTRRTRRRSRAMAPSRPCLVEPMPTAKQDASLGKRARDLEEGEWRRFSSHSPNILLPATQVQDRIDEGLTHHNNRRSTSLPRPAANTRQAP